MVEFIKSKKEMSEEDIKANFITPAIIKDGKMVSISLTKNTSLMVELRLEEIRLVVKKEKNQTIHCITNLELELQLLRQRIINTAFEQDYNKLLNMERF
ncbi:type I restriction-modification system, R subunit [Streptococcus pneumoniae]|nr:type I restriction-modification system, R subunit [Streptococcus pneumoniae]VJO41959.1 type I restriction-modification system, R subunit [Streptococcus pneumoniae]VOQ99632.1 type I restriction-modification system, R subunit [Streptococcus pneumoniae]